MIYREAVRKLKALGCVEVPRRSGGSHRKWRNLATGATAVVPDWQGKDIRTGTRRAAIGRLGLTWDDFDMA